MTYSDCFWLLGAVLTVMLPLVLLLRAAAAAARGPGHASGSAGALKGARMLIRIHPVLSTALAAALAAVVLLLAGCTLGPNYRGAPQVAGTTVKTFQRALSASTTTGEPMASWWTALNDPELDHLVDLAVTDSPDVRKRRRDCAMHAPCCSSRGLGCFPIPVCPPPMCAHAT